MPSILMRWDALQDEHTSVCEDPSQGPFSAVSRRLYLASDILGWCTELSHCLKDHEIATDETS